MGQNSSFYLEAKSTLNDNNPEPYTDLEVIQILELLNILTDVIYNRMIQ